MLNNKYSYIPQKIQKHFLKNAFSFIILELNVNNSVKIHQKIIQKYIVLPKIRPAELIFKTTDSNRRRPFLGCGKGSHNIPFCNANS